jgi:hypothetical protein
MQSVASSTTEKRLKGSTFYLDASIYSRVLAERIRQAGANVEHAGGAFRADALDEEWLAACGERGWIVLTRDNRIRHRALELQALTAANVAAFAFTATRATAGDTADTIERRLAKFANMATSERRPFLYTFGLGGSLTRVKLRQSP